MNRLKKLLEDKYAPEPTQGQGEWAIGAPVPLLKAIMSNCVSDLAKQQGSSVKEMEGSFMLLKQDVFTPVLATNIRRAAEASRIMAEKFPDMGRTSVFDMCFCFCHYHDIPAGPMLDLILACDTQQREAGEPESIRQGIQAEVDAGKDHAGCLCMRCAIVETVRLILFDGKDKQEAKDIMIKLGRAKFGDDFMKPPTSELQDAETVAKDPSAQFLAAFQQAKGAVSTEPQAPQPEPRGEPEDKESPDKGFAA